MVTKDNQPYVDKNLCQIGDDSPNDATYHAYAGTIMCGAESEVFFYPATIHVPGWSPPQAAFQAPPPLCEQVLPSVAPSFGPQCHRSWLQLGITAP